MLPIDRSRINSALSGCEVNDDQTEYNIIGTFDLARYKVPTTKIIELWHTCASLLDSCSIDLAEPQGAYVSLALNFKLSFNDSTPNTDGYLSEEFLVAMGSCVQDALYTTYIMENKDCLIFSPSASNNIMTRGEESEDDESELPRPKSRISIPVVHVFELRFPLLRVPRDSIKKFFYPILIKKLNESDVFSHLTSIPIYKDFERIIVEDDYTKLQMIGTINRCETRRRVFEKLYRMNSDNNGLESIPINMISTWLDLEKSSFIVSRALSMSNFLMYTKNLNYWIHAYFSASFATGVAHVRPNITAEVLLDAIPSHVTQTETASRKSGFPVNNDILSSLEVSSFFCSLIDDVKFKVQNYWRDIGKALYNVSHGSPEGLKIWIDASTKRGLKESDCMKYYYSFKYNNTMGNRTLAWYAKYGSKAKEYDKWIEQWRNNKIESVVLSQTDQSIADFIYMGNWLTFLTSPRGARKKQWFEFNGNRWTDEWDDVRIKRIINTNTVGYFRNFISKVKDRPAETDKERNEKDAIVKCALKVITILETVTKSNKILEALSDLFFIPNLDDIFDRNQSYLGMDNGVLEVMGNDVIFRPGKPDDYITLSTRNTYVDVPDDYPGMIALKEWIDQCFPDEALKRYFMKYAASCLKGGNIDKSIFIMTGEGWNSKSKIEKLFMLAFGKYAIKLPTSIFSIKQGNSGAAVPELARMENMRIAWTQEPPKGVQTNMDWLKAISGDDSTYIRKLYVDGKDIESTAKVSIACNMIPIINGDLAGQGRIKIMPFVSVWSINAPKTKEEQDKLHIYPMDRDFGSKINDMVIPFINLTMKWYPIYREEGMEEPAIVTRAAQQYWMENDVYLCFMNACLETVIEGGILDTRYRISLPEMHLKIKTFMTQFFTSLKLPDYPTFTSEIKPRLTNMGIVIENKEVIGMRWIGESTVPILSIGGMPGATSAAASTVGYGYGFHK